MFKWNNAEIVYLYMSVSNLNLVCCLFFCFLILKSDKYYRANL